MHPFANPASYPESLQCKSIHSVVVSRKMRKLRLGGDIELRLLRLRLLVVGLGLVVQRSLVGTRGLLLSLLLGILLGLLGGGSSTFGLLLGNLASWAVSTLVGLAALLLESNDLGFFFLLLENLEGIDSLASHGSDGGPVFFKARPGVGDTATSGHHPVDDIEAVNGAVGALDGLASLAPEGDARGIGVGDGAWGPVVRHVAVTPLGGFGLGGRGRLLLLLVGKVVWRRVLGGLLLGGRRRVVCADWRNSQGAFLRNRLVLHGRQNSSGLKDLLIVFGGRL